MKLKNIFFLLILSSFNLNANKRIIVFIHGTILPLTSVPTSLDEFLNLFGKNANPDETKLCENSISRFYQRAVNQSRTDGIHKYQPISNLNLIRFEDSQNKKVSNILLQLFYKSFKQINPRDEIELYTFGWDGRLDKEKREKWGKILYQQLIEKVEENKNASIEIYAHSHGGNVALNLATAEKELQQNLEIERLILLGTPIQEETSELSNSKIFKKIYSVYSTNDFMQTFEHKINSEQITKRRFSKKNLPSNIQNIEIENGTQKPNHWQLWFYGKTSSNFIQNFIYHFFVYKKEFELFPYPTSLFMPHVITKIERDIFLRQEPDLYLNISKRTNLANDYKIEIKPKVTGEIQIVF